MIRQMTSCYKETMCLIKSIAEMIPGEGNLGRCSTSWSWHHLTASSSQLVKVDET